MEKKVILFVDDEPNILDGLRRMLRSMRNEFELCFAESGHSALEMMENQNFDIIFSDMRMPGMDGAQFLSEVKSRYPHAIRVMLTGQADDASIMRTVGVVHQFLAKPCDPERLKDTILRSSALHQLMTDGNLKDIISSIETLPSLPEMYSKLQNKLRDPDASIDDIANIISQDIAMTAKILQLVNSSFFGLFQKVETPARAVNLLGLDTIKALVLGLQIFSDIKIVNTVVSVSSLWQHSMMVGSLAKKIAIAETDDNNIINDSYISGILHDIGKLILLSKMPDEYVDLIQSAGENQISLYLAEKDRFKSTHSDMGAYLIGLWGFQNNIIEAIGFHHQMENYPATQFTPALAVHVADVMYYVYNPEEMISEAGKINEKHLESIGLGHRIPEWQKICENYLEQQKND